MRTLSKQLILFCRGLLAALHYNENAGRMQATKTTGESRYDIRFPKYKQGGFVVRKILTEATFGKVEMPVYE